MTCVFWYTVSILTNTLTKESYYVWTTNKIICRGGITMTDKKLNTCPDCQGNGYHKFFTNIFEDETGMKT